MASTEKLIYVPNAPGLERNYPFDPTKLGLKFEDVWLTTRDKVKIHCWYLPYSAEPSPGIGKEKKSVPTVLWLQENAGNMSYRLLFVKPLLHAAMAVATGVALLDWRWPLVSSCWALCHWR